jgi:hypothetical protein
LQAQEPMRELTEIPALLESQVSYA